MRWTNYLPTEGDKRIRTSFLLWPKTIKQETRWMEKATWEEIYECGFDWCRFIPVRWIDIE